MKPTDIITINTTFKITAEELSGFEWELRQAVNVIDFKHISDRRNFIVQMMHLKSW